MAKTTPEPQPYQKLCINCADCLLGRGLTGNLVGACCTHGGVNRAVDLLYHCKNHTDGGGYFEIENISSSDEAQDFITEHGWKSNLDKETE